MSPYQIIYGKSCHIPVELDHRSYGAVKNCNTHLEEAGLSQLLQIQELKEIWLDAYNNSDIYKQKTKLVHDTNVLRKQFKEGDKVLSQIPFTKNPKSLSSKRLHPRDKTRLSRKEAIELFANRGVVQEQYFLETKQYKFYKLAKKRGLEELMKKGNKANLTVMREFYA
ncbi:uncharacterized protein LOC114760912 [Neltuma alba]|uniref:uncharacterized protein LOC114760912 n=1 Tax=Neltuma alba TaxID=207710 RepID=UPI0010A319EF|nr:uncharacterized protein LOC114760912 [Prosopis alba]